MAIKKGSKVKLDYEGKFENGEVFDSSKKEGHSHPLEFVAGESQVVKGFDEAVMGMEKGQEKEFKLEPKDAYGERKEELKQKVPKTSLPKDQEIKKGMTIVVGNPEGMKMPVQVVDVDDESITLDLNHPLAGKTLIFNIKIIDVED